MQSLFCLVAELVLFGDADIFGEDVAFVAIIGDGDLSLLNSVRPE